MAELHDEETSENEVDDSSMEIVPIDEDSSLDNEIDDSEILEKNTSKVTYAQALFIKWLPYVRVLEKAKASGEATIEDLRLLDDLKIRLYTTIEFYAEGLITKGMSSYRKPNDYREDLRSECLKIFLEMLPKYDTSYAPTTYFKSYFLQVISAYKHDYSQNMKSNDAKNCAKVRKVISKYEKLGLPVDVNILSRECNMTPKIVRNTLKRMENSIQANIEERDVASDIMQPERMFFKNYTEEIILNVLKTTLTEQEIKFYILRTENNGDDRREMPFNRIAEVFGIQPHEAKAIWQNIIRKLESHPLLREIFNRKKEDSIELQIHTDASVAMESDILGEFAAFGDVTNDIFLGIPSEPEEDKHKKLAKALSKELSYDEVKFFLQWVLIDGKYKICNLNEYKFQYLKGITTRICNNFSLLNTVLGELLSIYGESGVYEKPTNLSEYIKYFNSVPTKPVNEFDTIAVYVGRSLQLNQYDMLMTELENLLCEDEESFRYDFLMTKAETDNNSLEEVANIYSLTTEEVSCIWDDITKKLTSHPVIKKMFVSF